MGVVAASVGAMTPEQLFLASDAALRDVVDQLTARHLSAPAPQEWTQIPDPTIRDIVSRHAYDEAWIRGVIAGGNRNFGQTYGLAGRIIADKCTVPLLYRFELAGNDQDIARVRVGLDQFWGKTCLTMA